MICLESLYDRLQHRVNKPEIVELSRVLLSDDAFREALIQWLSDTHKSVAWHSAYILVNTDDATKNLFSSKIDDVVNVAQSTPYDGCLRMLLTFLFRFSLAVDCYVSLLDFCYSLMLNEHKPYGVRAMSMKLAYKLSSQNVELLDEFVKIIDFNSSCFSSPSLLSVYRKIGKRQLC